jgi:hypothetical protein
MLISNRPMNRGASSAPGPRSPSRWGLLLVALLVVALVATRFLPARKPAPATPAADTTHVATVTPRASAPAPLARSAPVPDEPGSPNSSVLRNASRAELLAYARDLLARGGPLENIVALLEFLVADRPELAVDLARDIGRTDGERHVLLYATLSAWAAKDAPAALIWAFRHADAYDIPGRASLLYLVLEQIAADNPASALAATQTYLRFDPSEAGALDAQDVARFTLEALIKKEHADLAKDAIERWAHSPEGKHLTASDFEIVAMALARNSFPSAGAWLESLPSLSARNQAYLAFATAWARDDAAAAMDWSQKLSPADGGDDVRVAMFAGWLRSDRPAAMQWLRAHNSWDAGRLLMQLDAPAVAPSPSVGN